MIDKIRTLKDIQPYNKINARFVNIDTLKTEAVNDIKYYNTLQGEGDYSDEQIEAVTEYILKKNNLTEEDLKW